MMATKTSLCAYLIAAFSLAAVALTSGVSRYVKENNPAAAQQKPAAASKAVTHDGIKEFLQRHQPPVIVQPIPSPGSFLVVGDTVKAFSGWVDFCQRYYGECEVPKNKGSEVIVLSKETWKILQDVNRTVNETIQPVTDMEHWGVIEKWDIPADGKDDCEDYVLMKRKMLMQNEYFVTMGYNERQFLITGVLDRMGERHAVLTVKTDRGDVILDNQTNEILAPELTGYTFIKTQSVDDPNIWVRITGFATITSQSQANDNESATNDGRVSTAFLPILIFNPSEPGKNLDQRPNLKQQKHVVVRIPLPLPRPAVQQPSKIHPDAARTQPDHAKPTIRHLHLSY